jgi:hypothetical protein
MMVEFSIEAEFQFKPDSIVGFVDNKVRLLDTRFGTV